jgi:hypothetical protein
MALAERARLRLALERSGLGGSEGVGTLRAGRGEDGPQSRQLVYADLGPGQLPGAFGEGGGTLDCAPRSTNGFTMSSGSGKTMVEFWLTPMSSRVCR